MAEEAGSDRRTLVKGTREEVDEIGGYNFNNVKKARLNTTLTALLKDPILSDVSKTPSLSDVDTLISLELGSAMRVSVVKIDGSSFGMCWFCCL